MSILVVGSFAYDSIETPRGKVDRALGGSAVYFSAAASLFTKVNTVGVVGLDYRLSELDFLKQRGVGFEGLKRVNGETFAWKGVYGDDPNERETIYTHLGVFANFKPEIPEIYRKSEYVFLANIDPDLQLDVLKQVDKPRFVALDTMNFWIEGKLEALTKVLPNADILIINDQEIRQLTGIKDLFRGARRVFEMGPKFVLVKKGEHGAVLISQSEKFFAAIYPVEEVFDPTGAGDTFAGGFMGYIARQDSFDWMTMKRAIIYGTATASFVVEDFSINKLKQINLDDVEERVEQIRKMTNF